MVEDYRKINNINQMHSLDLQYWYHFIYILDLQQSAESIPRHHKQLPDIAHWMPENRFLKLEKMLRCSIQILLSNFNLITSTTAP